MCLDVMNNLFKVVLVIVCCITSSLGVAAPSDFSKKKTLLSKTTQINYFALTDKQISEALQWITDPTAQLLCQGYYLSKAIRYKGDLKKPLKKAAAYLSAKDASFSLKGPSVLKGDVELIEPYRRITANLAYEYPDKKTHRPRVIDLFHKVTLATPSSMIVASHLRVDLRSKLLSAYNALYRYQLNFSAAIKERVGGDQKDAHLLGLNAWGKARKIQKVGANKWVLHEVTYSTCPITHHSWQVQASRLVLNKKSGWGSATNAVLRVKSIPVFYLPYLNFPLDDRRKTGFLLPNYGKSSRSGIDIAFPYYWNIAPNVDMTFTPHYLQQRGVFLNNEMRYLTSSSHGQLQLGLIPHDRKFAVLKQTAKSEFLGDDLLPNLQNSSARRYQVHVDNITQLSANWQSHLNYNYVSDRYAVNDLGQSGLSQPVSSQLLQSADLDFQNEHWNFKALVKGYQGLSQVFQQVENQYQRVPGLFLSSHYRDSLFGFDYSFSSAAINFFKGQDEWKTTPPVIGERLHVRPGIAYSFYRPWGYLRPELEWDFTRYALRRQIPGFERNPTRWVPISNVGAGLHFERSFFSLGGSYRQTLSPRLYYLFVPKRNGQEQIPLFDTVRQAFTYRQLFSKNRFSSVDRIGDANQLTLGLNSRVFNKDSGREKLSAGLGMIFYFRNRQVHLHPGARSQAAVVYDSRPTSPLTGMINLNLSNHWVMAANTAWNIQLKELDNQDFTITYAHSSRQQLSASYHFIRDVTPFEQVDNPNKFNMLHSYTLSGVWGLNSKWSIVGRFNDDVSPLRGQSYWGGFSYNSCCWGVEAVYYRAFNGIINDQHRDYSTGFYLQFRLKGFGSIGNGNAGAMLASQVSGYHTSFS
jgi:LPS-assembly protein